MAASRAHSEGLRRVSFLNDPANGRGMGQAETQSSAGILSAGHGMKDRVAVCRFNRAPPGEDCGVRLGLAVPDSRRQDWTLAVRFLWRFSRRQARIPGTMKKNGWRFSILLSLLLLLGVACTKSPKISRPGPRAPMAQPPGGEPPRIGWAVRAAYQARGPHPIDLAGVPRGVFDPNHQLARGRGGNRIESPLSREASDVLREQAKRLKPNANIQFMAPAPSLQAPSAGTSFDSLDANDCCGGGLNVPPDPELAVGPNHIIAVVNVAFEIYDKSGNVLSGPTTFSSFFAGMPGCSSTNVFDPNVLYDEAENRFVLGIDGNGSDYCVAATQGGNPLGLWNRYRFPTDIGGAFFDYPHAGVGRDAIYMGSNQFRPRFLEGRVFAMDKFAMYDGMPLTVVSRSTGIDGSTPQPMNLHGFLQGTWPTSGPHYIMTEVFDGANHTVWSWTDPFGADIFTPLGDVDLNDATGVVAGYPIDVPQAGSSDELQANDWRGLDTEYRNGSIWMTNTIACNPVGGAVDCVRWAPDRSHRPDRAGCRCLLESGRIPLLSRFGCQ